MNLDNVKTIHDVLIEVLNISIDIDVAAMSLASSDYCPSHDRCTDSCVRCWRSWLESEVSTNDHA